MKTAKEAFNESKKFWTNIEFICDKIYNDHIQRAINQGKISVEFYYEIDIDQLEFIYDAFINLGYHIHYDDNFNSLKISWSRNYINHINQKF